MRFNIQKVRSHGHDIMPEVYCIIMSLVITQIAVSCNERGVLGLFSTLSSSFATICFSDKVYPMYFILSQKLKDI